MKRLLAATAAVLAIAAPAARASAGVYTDDLTKCLVRSADAGDQTRLMQWMFALIALNPAVQPNATITAQQREGFDRQAAALLQRLLTVDCRKETVAALKYEGSSAIEASFRVLGEVAVRGLMSDPKVAGGLQQLTTYIDPEKIAEVGREAGLADQRDKPEK
jgi:hypothetical protein